MKQEIKPATYEQIRAQAQAAANVDGFDRGLENNPYAGWLYFMLPAKGHRTGRELRCEVVSCEDISKCRPGHGPAASDTNPDDTPSNGFSRTVSGAVIPNCERDIFERGTVVRTLLGSANQNEELVLHVRAKGFKIDWHFVAGRGVVKTLSNPDEVNAALDASLVELGWR